MLRNLPGLFVQIILHVHQFSAPFLDTDLNRIPGPVAPRPRTSESEDDSQESSQINDQNLQVSIIDKAFNNRRSFTCPLVKVLLETGKTAAQLSPEDIDIVAVIGDALSTGVGLWSDTNIEFRGAAFTTGGDANIDGLVTFANILAVFNPKVEGISHGMGHWDGLPRYQLNMAETGAESEQMPKQNSRVVSCQKTESELGDVVYYSWNGGSEFCKKCDEPDVNSLRQALTTIRRSIPKAFVVLVGPIHVARSSQLTYNLLKPRCPCLTKITNEKMRLLQRKWRELIHDLENEFTKRHYPNFALVALTMLRIESRFPEQLFVKNRPLLNRRGHTYAAKWLWNRLIAGPRYNSSRVPLSEDSYYCPTLKCPYFRTPDNLNLGCIVQTKSEYARIHSSSSNPKEKRHGNGQIRDHIVLWVFILVTVSTLSVVFFGTLFYCHGMKATKGRFESLPGV